MNDGTQFTLDEIYGSWHVAWYETSIGIVIAVLSAIIAALIVSWGVWYFLKRKRRTDFERARHQLRALNRRAKLGAINKQDFAKIYDILASAFTIFSQRYGIEKGCTHHERNEQLKSHLKDVKILQNLDSFLINEQDVRFAGQELSVDQLIGDVRLLNMLFDGHIEQK